MDTKKLIKETCLAALIEHGIVVTESVHHDSLDSFRKTRELEKDGHIYAFVFSTDHTIVAEMFQAVLSKDFTGTPVLVKSKDEVSLWFKYKPQNPVVYSDDATKTFVFNTPLDTLFLRNNSSFDREVTAMSVTYERKADYEEAAIKLAAVGFEIKSINSLVG